MKLLRGIAIFTVMVVGSIALYRVVAGIVKDRFPAAPLPSI